MGNSILFLCGLIAEGGGRFSPTKIDGAVLEVNFGRVDIFFLQNGLSEKIIEKLFSTISRKIK